MGTQVTVSEDRGVHVRSNHVHVDEREKRHSDREGSIGSFSERDHMSPATTSGALGGMHQNPHTIHLVPIEVDRARRAELGEHVSSEVGFSARRAPDISPLSTAHIEPPNPRLHHHGEERFPAHPPVHLHSSEFVQDEKLIAVAGKARRNASVHGALNLLSFASAPECAANGYLDMQYTGHHHPGRSFSSSVSTFPPADHETRLATKHAAFSSSQRQFSGQEQHDRPEYRPGATKDVNSSMSAPAHRSTWDDGVAYYGSSSAARSASYWHSMHGQSPPPSSPFCSAPPQTTAATYPPGYQSSVASHTASMRRAPSQFSGPDPQQRKVVYSENAHFGYARGAAATPIVHNSTAPYCRYGSTGGSVMTGMVPVAAGHADQSSSASVPHTSLPISQSQPAQIGAYRYGASSGGHSKGAQQTTSMPVSKVKGPWRPEEDALLTALVSKYGAKGWTVIASHIPGRTGKQARERWLNQLNPELTRRAWTREEDMVIMEMHAKVGNRWSEIAKHPKLRGRRTDNSVKNRYNTTIRRQISEYTNIVRSTVPADSSSGSATGSKEDDLEPKCEMPSESALQKASA
eukprot:CAMPEP_0185849122 /NCGR_PEP_ID=MMETSP1354-20130828/3739_1 /TAXON_ID=708628 /ORGANISM="Erythrolobus madagascarensis, Strain CCMP3276" /LENGTH=575 /DNA_ID=CAMNT_0028549603 /DNA_START=181 /DNA_END=1908 /DNA_ORIENTATION=+